MRKIQVTLFYITLTVCIYTEGIEASKCTDYGCWGGYGATCKKRTGSDIKCCHGKQRSRYDNSASWFITCGGVGAVPCICHCKPPLVFDHRRDSCSPERTVDINFKLNEGSFNRINKPKLTSDYKNINAQPEGRDAHKNHQRLHSSHDHTSIMERENGQGVDVAYSLVQKRSDDSGDGFPKEIRDAPNFPIWAVTFIVLCLVCVMVAVILYMY